MRRKTRKNKARHGKVKARQYEARQVHGVAYFTDIYWCAYP
jgi:hypothetical protein